LKCPREAVLTVTAVRALSEKVDTYRGPWESFTFFVNAHPDFVELLHVAGPILHILAVGIWDNRIEGIKQMCEGYIISAVDEAVTERD